MRAHGMVVPEGLTPTSVLAGLGRALFLSSLLLAAFLGFKVWGTNLITLDSQQRLRTEIAVSDRVEVVSEAQSPVFDDSAPTAEVETISTATPEVVQVAEEVQTVSTPTPVTPAPDNVGVGLVKESAEAALLEVGAPLGVLRIPAIDVDLVVVGGVGTEELKMGPGHYPGTALPGGLGNAAFAGHRTTYGAPFLDVDRLQAGDVIEFARGGDIWVYEVTGTQIVSPTDAHVLLTEDPLESVLTLTSCHPKRSTAQRIIVSAALRHDLSSAVQPSARYLSPAGYEMSESVLASPLEMISADLPDKRLTADFSVRSRLGDLMVADQVVVDQIEEVAVNPEETEVAEVLAATPAPQEAVVEEPMSGLSGGAVGEVAPVPVVVGTVASADANWFVPEVTPRGWLGVTMWLAGLLLLVQAMAWTTRRIGRWSVLLGLPVGAYCLWGLFVSLEPVLPSV
ncbi:MAG: class E sortase [Ilumatobacteraceae bacterium]|nr:class E sortase [Ilumatobacteraceae bacterium]